MSFQSTLKLWPNGAVTLPKAWRDRYDTKNFLAQENDNGHLVIIPIVDAVFYEEEDNFGVRFPQGIEAGELLQQIENTQEEMKKNI